MGAHSFSFLSHIEPPDRKNEQFPVQDPVCGPISFPVRDLLANAESIFQTALAGEGEVSILIGQDGAIRILMGAAWPLDSLQAEHGSRAVYRVARPAGRLRVEGRSATSACLLQSFQTGSVARRLLADRPRYVLAA